MHFRTRLRISTIPLLLISISLIAFIAIMWVPGVKSVLADNLAPNMPLAILGVSGLLPLMFAAYYVMSYADVRRHEFTVRSFTTKHRVDLKKLVVAEVWPKARSGSRRRAHHLILRLEDERGGMVFLPLNSWRDEDLLMARLLRATVDCRVRIEGEPHLVQRFSGLLDTYKSWDRQQVAA